MRKNKKTTEYVPSALKNLGNTLLMVRQPRSMQSRFFGVQINLEGLQEAVKSLNKVNRERIEKFWGLTGGPNHSKRLGHCDAKDVAFKEMSNLAVLALRDLLTLDYINMYDPTISVRLTEMAKKVNKEGVNISDMDCVKYLLAFFVYVDNGPKMPWEENPMRVDTDLPENFSFDEYEVLNQMWEEISKYPDETISLKLLMGFFEIIDFNDMLIIKKSLRIEIPKETLPEGVKIEDVEVVRTVTEVRKLKERIFQYGAWDVVSTLIQGDLGHNVNLEAFMRELNSIRKNWGKVNEFKTGEKTLKTASEIRTLNVYNIGGLEFTDIYEVMYLYLVRNLIAP